MTVLFEVITVLPLLFVLLLMLRERRRFVSLSFFLAGIPFIILARGVEICIKFQIGPFADHELNELAMNTISDLADVIGILLLVVGFIKTIRFQHEAADKIERLEFLLPMCAACKKFRTEGGEWKPIEEFVVTRGGASAVSHGYCPECAERLRREIDAFSAHRRAEPRPAPG
jgi:hypothetical protein